MTSSLPFHSVLTALLRLRVVALRLAALSLLLAAAAQAQASPLYDAVLDAGASPADAAGLAEAMRASVQEAKVGASDAEADDVFGASVSLSGDRALIGAPNNDDVRSNSGSAYVFVRSGSTWTQEAKLVATDPAENAFFGSSVSLSGDRALVGASGDGFVGTIGSAYVFVRSGSTWTQQAKLVAADAAAYDSFGNSVSLSGDRALVGAWNDGDAGSRIGSAYVFVRSGSTWTQEAKLVATDGAAFDQFGRSVSLLGDRALIGAFTDDDGGNDSGSAYVFVRSGSMWTQEAKLVADDAAVFDNFGVSVSLSGDRALVGAMSLFGASSGSAYVFVRLGSTWTQEAKIVADDAWSNDTFGVSVSLSGDRALVGSSLRACGCGGAAYLFARSGSTWTQEARFVPADGGSNDNFGESVSLSSDRAFIGAPRGAGFGSAYVFALPPPVAAFTPSALSVTLPADATTTETVTLSNTAEAGAADLAWSASVTGGALPGDCADGQTLDVTGSGFVASAQAGIRELGQSFTVPCDGILTSISLQTISTLGSGTQPWTGTLRLYQGEGTAGPQIASAPGAGSNPDETPVPFTATFATPASVVAGQVYTWFWDLDTGESGLVELSNIYPGGSAYSTVNTGDPAQAGAATTEDFPFSATFAPGAPSWVTVAPSSGSIAPGTSAPLGVTFDATGLTDGIYTAGLVVTTNDPTTPSVTVPLTLTVGAPTQYVVTAASAGNGTITPASQNVAHGSAAGFTVTPEANHHAVSVTGDTCTPADQGGGIWSVANIMQACAVTATFARDATDLQVAKDSGLQAAQDGQVVVYAITVANAGPLAVNAAQLVDVLPAELVDGEWACLPSESNTDCPPPPFDAGIGDLYAEIDLPVDGFLRFDLAARIQAGSGAVVSNTATITPPVELIDLNVLNNSATDSTLVVPHGIFADSFESSPAPLTVPAATKAQRKASARLGTARGLE